jgi:hypothetical protein
MAAAALHTFTFQILFCFSLFSILSVRERKRFWASPPSRALTLALLLDGLIGTVLSTTGVPGSPRSLGPRLSWWSAMPRSARWW